MINLVIGFGDESYTIPFSDIEDKTMSERDFLKCLVEGVDDEKNISSDNANPINDMQRCLC